MTRLWKGQWPAAASAWPQWMKLRQWVEASERMASGEIKVLVDFAGSLPGRFGVRAMLLDLFHCGLPKKACGLEEEDEDENGERDAIAIIGDTGDAAGKRFQQTQQQAPECSAR